MQVEQLTLRRELNGKEGLAMIKDGIKSADEQIGHAKLTSIIGFVGTKEDTKY